jgi:hypothetical protein
MAAVFNGTDCQLSRTTGLPSITSTTWMAWVYPLVLPTSGQFQAILAHGTPSGTYYAMGLRHDGTNLRWTIWNGAAFTNGLATPVVNQWAQMVLTINGTGSNGMALWESTAGSIATSAFATATAQAGVAANTLWVGNSGAGTHWLNARVAAVKVFSGVCGAGDIRAESRQYLPVAWNLVLSWHPLFVHTETDLWGATWTAAGSLATATGANAVPTISWNRLTRPRPTRAAAAAAPGTPQRPVQVLQAVARASYV